MSLVFILVALLLLNILIIVHEIGHFAVARLFGVKVLEFSVGFGPVLLKRISRKSGIQYSLRGVPIGGFVKMAGVDIALEGEPAPESASDPHSMTNQPAWKKILIILAGPISNLILAAITLVVMYAAIGVPQQVDRTALIGNVEPKSPAYEAGLSTGDRILTIDGQKIELWTDLERIITGSKGQPLQFTLDRRGQTIARDIKPFFDPELKVYRIGIMPRYYDFKRIGLGRSLVAGFSNVYYGSVGIIETIVNAIRGKARVPLSGPIGIIGVTSQSTKAGPVWLLTLFASMSLFLGLFNLLPIPLPILDGGWVVIYLIEKLRRREFTVQQKAAAQLFGLIVLASFFVFVTYGDLIGEVRRFLNR